MSTSGDDQADRAPLPANLQDRMDRRGFLATSAALIGAGVVAGCTGGMSVETGPAAGGAALSAVQGGNARSLAMFDASASARALGAWMETRQLRREPDRAVLFDVPPRPALPTRTVVEDRASLIGESAYKVFQHDSFATSRFTRDQMTSVSSVARADLAAQIGSVIHHGGPIVAMACCCCCSCCSLCCSSCNKGDNGGASLGRFQVSAVPFGDPTIEYGGAVRQYFRGVVGVQDDGQAVGVLESVSNDAAMTVLNITIGVAGAQGGVREFAFTPGELQQLGPRGLATRLFSGARPS